MRNWGIALLLLAGACQQQKKADIDNAFAIKLQFGDRYTPDCCQWDQTCKLFIPCEMLVPDVISRMI